MNKKVRNYIVLALVLILFLTPIASVLSSVEALQGGKAGLIAVGSFVLFSIIYWIVMIILMNKKKGK